MLGHAILISIAVLFVRNRAFHKKFKGIFKVRTRHSLSRRVSEFDLSNTQAVAHVFNDHCNDLIPVKDGSKPQLTTQPFPREENSHTKWANDDQISISEVRTRQHHAHCVFPMVGVGARLDLNNHPRDVPPNLPIHEDDYSGLKRIFRGTQRYFASKGFVSRNSSFHGLTPAERDELGGVEYRAVSFLSVIVPIYWLSFLVLGIVGVGGWLEANHPEISSSNGLSPFWTGAFFAVSAFVNSGMSLLDKNMTALQTKYDFH